MRRWRDRLPGRRAHSRAIAALTVAWCCGVAGAQGRGSPDLDFLATLPDTTDLVIAAEGLGHLRAAPAGQALERFLGEMNTWSMSVRSWGQVAGALGLSPERALEEVAGRQFALCIEGMSEPAATRRPRHAIITSISRPTEALLREKLKPAPRSVGHSQPILALENGAFEVSTIVPIGQARDGEGGEARVLISPRESGGYFDAMLPVMSGKPARAPLGATAAFAAWRRLPPGPVMILYRDLSPGGAGEDFFALSASVADDTIAGRYIASPAMLMRSPDLADTGGWPGRAVAKLEDEAILLLAGRPRQQPVEPGFEGPGAVGQTLLLTLLRNLNLDPEVEAMIDGVALVGVRRSEGQGRPGALSITGAIPVPDLSAFIPHAERWVVRTAGVPGMVLPPAAPGTVPVLTLGEGVAPILPGLVHAGGCMSWGFARQGDGPGGWWVINIRTAPGDESLAASWVQAMSAALSAPGGANDRTLYRLIIRPGELLGVRRAPGPAKDEPNNLRWLDRVETRVTREEGGLLSGTLAIRLNTALLKELPPTAPGQ